MKQLLFCVIVLFLVVALCDIVSAEVLRDNTHMTFPTFTINNLVALDLQHSYGATHYPSFINITTSGLGTDKYYISVCGRLSPRGASPRGSNFCYSFTPSTVVKGLFPVKGLLYSSEAGSYFSSASTIHTSNPSMLTPYVHIRFNIQCDPNAPAAPTTTTGTFECLLTTQYQDQRESQQTFFTVNLVSSKICSFFPNSPTTTVPQSTQSPSATTNVPTSPSPPAHHKTNTKIVLPSFSINNLLNSNVQSTAGKVTTINNMFRQVPYFLNFSASGLGTENFQIQICSKLNKLAVSEYTSVPQLAENCYNMSLSDRTRGKSMKTYLSSEWSATGIHTANDAAIIFYTGVQIGSDGTVALAFASFFLHLTVECGGTDETPQTIDGTYQYEYTNAVWSTPYLVYRLRLVSTAVCGNNNNGHNSNPISPSASATNSPSAETTTSVPLSTTSTATTTSPHPHPPSSINDFVFPPFKINNLLSENGFEPSTGASTYKTPYFLNISGSGLGSTKFSVEICSEANVKYFTVNPGTEIPGPTCVTLTLSGRDALINDYRTKNALPTSWPPTGFRTQDGDGSFVFVTGTTVMAGKAPTPLLIYVIVECGGNSVTPSSVSGTYSARFNTYSVTYVYYQVKLVSTAMCSGNNNNNNNNPTSVPTTPVTTNKNNTATTTATTTTSSSQTSNSPTTTTVSQSTQSPATTTQSPTTTTNFVPTSPSPNNNNNITIPDFKLDNLINYEIGIAGVDNSMYNRFGNISPLNITGFGFGSSTPSFEMCGPQIVKNCVTFKAENTAYGFAVVGDQTGSSSDGKYFAFDRYDSHTYYYITVAFQCSLNSGNNGQVTSPFNNYQQKMTYFQGGNSVKLYSISFLLSTSAVCSSSSSVPNSPATAMPQSTASPQTESPATTTAISPSASTTNSPSAETTTTSSSSSSSSSSSTSSSSVPLSTTSTTMLTSTSATTSSPETTTNKPSPSSSLFSTTDASQQQPSSSSTTSVFTTTTQQPEVTTTEAPSSSSSAPTLPPRQSCSGTNDNNSSSNNITVNGLSFSPEKAFGNKKFIINDLVMLGSTSLFSSSSSSRRNRKYRYHLEIEICGGKNSNNGGGARLVLAGGNNNNNDTNNNNNIIEFPIMTISPLAIHNGIFLAFAGGGNNDTNSLYELEIVIECSNNNDDDSESQTQKQTSSSNSKSSRLFSVDGTFLKQRTIGEEEENIIIIYTMKLKSPLISCNVNTSSSSSSSNSHSGNSAAAASSQQGHFLGSSLSTKDFLMIAGVSAGIVLVVLLIIFGVWSLRSTKIENDAASSSASRNHFEFDRTSMDAELMSET